MVVLAPGWSLLGPQLSLSRRHAVHRFTRFILMYLAAAIAFPVADAVAITTDHTGDYLLVGRGPQSVAVGVKVSSSKSLGRIYTVPSASDPDVDDTPPWPLPAGATAPVEGISNDGNIAVTNSAGTYDFSDIEIWADIGVRCDNDVTGRCREGWSGSTLNGGGTFANDATKMSQIESELVAAALEISALPGTNTWSLSGAGTKNAAGVWVLDSDGVDTNTTITLGSGLNVIKIATGGNDAKINNAGLVINGDALSSVIFVLEDQSQNFLFTNASITHGMGGIASNSILFAMLNGGNDSNFDFSKVIVNGASFWDLSLDGGQINMDNVQGCGQWVADHLNFNDVQLARCSFSEPIPEPGAATLFAVGFLCVAAALRRKRA
jgi:hypothetical protein